MSYWKKLSWLLKMFLYWIDEAFIKFLEGDLVIVHAWEILIFFFWSVLCLFPRIATLREQIVCFPFRKLWDGLFSFDLVFLCNLSMSCYYPEDIFIVFLWYLPGQNKSSYSLRLNQWDWRGWNSNRCNIYTWTFAWLKILSEISVKKTIGVVNEIKHGQILRWRKLVS